ncbi:MAG: DUF11 domain-containing protein [Acidobacteriia bacterium]|nr:DUF11 domain-containing protein [Terriglobia bacterium]
MGRGRPGWRSPYTPLTPSQVQKRRALSAAATVTVNSTADVIHSPGCATTGTGTCSLRDAILFANANSGSTIVFSAATDGIPFTLTIPGHSLDATQGELAVLAAITITGNGPANTIIQGGTDATNGVDKVFSFNPLGALPGFAVNLSGVMIQFGRNQQPFDSFDGEGGAFDFDAGLAGDGSLTVSNCVFTNNSTVDGDGGGVALFDGGTITISNTTFSNNTARTAGGASTEGGGIFIGFTGNVTTLTIQDSTITGNQAPSASPLQQGGGLFTFGGGSTNYQIHNTTISNNVAGNDGGGVFSGGPITIDQGSAITGNTSGRFGGGLVTNDTTAISNVTITGNGAASGGGGLYSNTGTTTVTNSRIANNTSTTGPIAVDVNAANGGTITGINNWWGTNSSPASMIAASGVTFDPWLVLTLNASPTTIRVNQTSDLTTAINTNSNSQTGFSIPDGAPVTFAGTLGTVNPTNATLTSSTATSTFTAGPIGGLGAGSSTVDNQTVNANIVVLVPPTISKTFGAATIPINGATSLSFTITNPNVAAINAVGFSDTFPINLVIATPNGLTGSCGGGTITATAGSGSVTLSGATIPAASACTFSVNVTGTFDAISSNSTNNVSSVDAGTGNTASASITVINPPSIAKGFGAVTIPLNGSTSLTFTINNTNINSTLNGTAFTDNLPAGLVVATPNGLTGSCGGGAITAAAGSSSVSLSGASLPPSTSCAFSVNVTGTTAGVKNNSVTVSSTNGGTGNTSNASLTVTAPPVIIKAFGAASIPLNGSTSLTFTIQNNNTTITLTGIGFTDTLPAGLVVSTPNGLTGTCGGGTITAAQGTNSIDLSGATLAQSSSCTFSVNVTGTAAGTQNNTTGAVTSTEGGTGGTASASILVVAPPSIAKAFGAANIPLNGTTSLTLTITNPAANTVALTGVAFTDTLPAGIVVATPNGLTNTCGGTATAVAGSGAISLTGGTLATSSNCTVAVNVTGTASGAFTNTTGAVSSTNGGTGNTASANLSVATPATITKSFGAATVPLNGSTSLSFTVTNPGANTIALTGVTFTDNLPAGLVVSTPNGLTGSCGGGTITAVAASSSVSLAGATLAASASCTFSVNVTGTTAGVKNNSVTVASTEGGTGNTSNASLTVVAPPVIIKAFGAASIPLNGATSLTFTIQNNDTTTTLTGVGFTDTLPAGLVISTPNGLTGTCGGGTITATAASGSIALSGATLAASTSCTFSVDVTGTTAGTKNNTTGAVTSTEGGTGGTASASLAVVAPPTITKAFGASNITLNGTTTLTFTINNPSTNTIVLSGIAFTDTFPAGLQVAATPGAVSNCGGTFTANAGAGSVSLTGGNLAPGAAKSGRSTAVVPSTCVLTVNVTGTSSGVLNNTTGAVSSTQSGPGATSNTATLTVAENADLSVSKTTLTATPQAGSNLVYTLTVNNAGPLTATGVQVTDTLPANLSFVSGAGPANWSCVLGAGSVVTCSKSTSMAVGETAALTLTLALDCGIADKISIANTAAVSFPGTDPNPSNNTSTATIQTSNPAAISPADRSFGPAGGTGVVKVTFAGSCNWTATSNDSFLTIEGTGGGSGNGEVHFTVAPNTGNNLRSGTMSIAGFTFTVTQTAVGEALLTAPGGGAGSLLTGGQGNNAQAGYATATPVLSKSAREADVNDGLFSTAVLSLTQNGVVVSEAGVPSEPVTTAARIFVDFRTNVPAKSDDLSAGTINVSTGIAVVNLGSAAANLTVTLRGPDGTTLTVGHGSLLAGGHRARFLDQLADVAPGFALPGNFGSAIQFGTLEVSSDQPISVVGLRLVVNQRGETLLTTTPSVDLTQSAASSTLIFPQMADGGGYRTTVLLLNSTTGVETGTLQVLDDHGSPLSVRPVGGVAGTSFAYSIAANGVFVFETDGSPATVHAGSIRILPDGFKPTPAGAGIFSFEPGATVVTQSGVPSATPTSHALIYVDLSGGHDTGLALMNPNNQPLSVQLQAFQADGLTPAGTIASVTLPPSGHLAAFVDQLVSGLPAGFTGVLNLSAPAPFAALTLRSLANTRGESLLTLFPIADFNQPASIPMVFPQIADGGGYRTQIIVANTNPLTAKVLISFFDDNGNLLDVVK